MSDSLEHSSDTSLRRLLYVVSQAYQFDLADTSTAIMRVLFEDFMEKYALSNYEELKDKIETSDFWQEKLFDYFLVPDTELMRDPSFWRYLRDDFFPTLKSDIRILLPDLNTGEELYSLLIALNESETKFNVEIEVSSVNPKKLDIIQNGFVYAKNFSLNSDNYNRFQGLKSVETYFDFSSGKAYMKPALLKDIKFTCSNWQEFKTEGYYDFIIYRNKLMLFNDHFHVRALQVITHILRDKGFLAIGINETLDISSAKFKFTEFHFGEKIYKKRTINGL